MAENITNNNNNNTEAAFLYSIPLISIITTTLITSKDLANGNVSGKYFWFYLSIGLVSASYLIISFIKKDRIRFGIVDVIILMLLPILLFANLNTNATRLILLILIILLIFYFRVFFYKNKKIVYWLSICYILTGLIECIWGLRQLYGFEQSQHILFLITGSFSNPGPYACYIAVIFPMAFYYALKYHICYKVKFHFRNISIYLLWGMSVLTVVSSILILPAAMSRTAWLAGIGGCGLILFYFFAKSKKVKSFAFRNRKIFILAVSITVLLIIAGGYGMYKFKKDSADGRTFIWKNTVELIKQNPLGVGIGNFSGSYGHVQAAYFESGKGTEDEKRVAGNPEYAFNEYLQICAEQGIFVLLLFLGIIGYSLYVGIKRKKIAATSSLLALLIAAGASYPFSVLPFLIVLVFLLALIHNGEKGISVPKPEIGRAHV